MKNIKDMTKEEYYEYIKDYYDCLKCHHRDPCEKEFGRIGIDEEDCSAVAGTHFCRRSWDGFKCCHSK